VKIAPQFSIAEKNWLLARPGDVIQLGQRERRAEIVVVIGQDVLRGIERELRLLHIALAGDDADFGGTRLVRHPLQLA
jgi:hypothetical protein